MNLLKVLIVEITYLKFGEVNSMNTFEIVENTADTRTCLSNKTTKELIDYLISVDQSIKAGFKHVIYFQEWSVGSDILRKRGYEILGPSDLYNL